MADGSLCRRERGGAPVHRGAVDRDRVPEGVDPAGQQDAGRYFGSASSRRGAGPGTCSRRRRWRGRTRLVGVPLVTMGFGRTSASSVDVCTFAPAGGPRDVVDQVLVVGPEDPGDEPGVELAGLAAQGAVSVVAPNSVARSASPRVDAAIAGSIAPVVVGRRAGVDVEREPGERCADARTTTCPPDRS